MPRPKFASAASNKNLKPPTPPGVPKPIIFGLLFYLGTLTVTQTAYGWSFMGLRWVGLLILTTICAFYWLFHLSRGKYRWDAHGLPYALIFFLATTLVSVFNSENVTFSALRWLSNAMLLLTCFFFLRGIFGQIPVRPLLMILKITMFFLLMISIWAPATKSIYDSPFFRGAMGDPNSLGHVAVISTLVYLHGAITCSHPGWRRVQGIIALFSFAILANTFARSSMAALLVGIIVMSLYYGVTRSLFSKALIFFFVTCILASPSIQSQILSFIGKERPKELEGSRIIRLEEPSNLAAIPATIFISRESLWTDAWDGFTQRPFLGWGFSMNKDTPRTWVIGATSIGMVRDATNDLLFILEGSGIVGFIGYVYLLIFIWRQSPTPSQRRAIQSGMKSRIQLPPGLRRNLGSSSEGFPTPMAVHISPDSRGNEPEIAVVERNHTHAIFYTLSVSLWVLFLFDGSAFSPGSLISAIYWLSAGVATALCSKATSDSLPSAIPLLRRSGK